MLDNKGDLYNTNNEILIKNIKISNKKLITDDIFSEIFITKKNDFLKIVNTDRIWFNLNQEVLELISNMK